MITINDQFPDYELTACVSNNADDAFVTQRRDDFNDTWRVYLFWPKDFTFVCPTEIKAYGDKHSEFVTRNTQLIGVSTDSEYVHLAWRQHHRDLADSPFPWLADIRKDLCRDLGVLDENAGVAHRATLIVDPDGHVQHISVHNGQVGRNPDETLRVLDALQTGQLCPCNWKAGDAVISD